jgi:hypothetical protein
MGERDKVCSRRVAGGIYHVDCRVCKVGVPEAVGRIAMASKDEGVLAADRVVDLHVFFMKGYCVAGITERTNG